MCMCAVSSSVPVVWALLCWGCGVQHALSNGQRYPQCEVTEHILSQCKPLFTCHVCFTEQGTVSFACHCLCVYVMLCVPPVEACWAG